LASVRGKYPSTAGENETLGEIQIPKGKVGLATISNVTMGAVLLKAGIPLDFKFAGILQIRNHDCLRFVELIEYTGSSLNPYEVFIAGKMTAVSGILAEGNGKILASFCELPALALPRVETVIKGLETMGISGVAKLGGISEPLCETPVGIGKFGMVLTDGLNLVAAAAEAGIEVVNHAGSGIIDFARLEVLRDF
jgi:repressor of nif and glnA expression